MRLRTLSWGNFCCAGAWRSSVRSMSRIGLGDVSNALTCEAMKGVPTLSNLMVEGQTPNSVEHGT